MRIVGDIHFLHFGCILFLITGFFAVIISALTEPLDPAYVRSFEFLTVFFFAVVSYRSALDPAYLRSFCSSYLVLFLPQELHL